MRTLSLDGFSMPMPLSPEGARHRGVARVAALAFSLALAPVAAEAAYEYTYVGQPFTITVLDFNPMTGNWDSTTSEGFVSASFESATLLTAGAGLETVPTFSLTSQASSPLGPTTLTYPYVFPPGYPFPPVNPSVIGVLQIGAVDASGLPTAWNLSIDYEFIPPTAHLLSNTAGTSNGVDSISGGYEGFSSWAGSGSGQPGKWTVDAIRPVPEPPAGILLMIGLAAGLAGAAIRRGQAASTGWHWAGVPSN